MLNFEKCSHFDEGKLLLKRAEYLDHTPLEFEEDAVILAEVESTLHLEEATVDAISTRS